MKHQVISTIEIIWTVTFIFLAFFIILVTVFIFAYLSRKKILAHKLKTKEIELQMQKEVLNTVIETQEEERRRISRDLHDDISSKLNAVSMNLHLLKRSNLSEANREELADNMLEACDLVMKSARQIAHNLTPSTLENIGLHSSIQELCKEMSSGPVRIQYENPKGQSYFDFLNLEQHIHLFRIIQELINNSIRHGKAMEITLSLMSGQQHKMIYTDNGSGILPENVKKNKGMGIKNILSRCDIIQAHPYFDTQTENGFRFILNF